VLRGEEPVESIDLSYKGLGVASAVLIASMVSSNTVIKSLKSVRHTQMQALLQQPVTAADREYAHFVCSLWNNRIGDDGAKSLADALKINSSLHTLK
jgi:hypothetical protein